tara:strand:+ start:404 stop:895 length:492 start_codon:yes stop_codon:yes gene_type:complete
MKYAKKINVMALHHFMYSASIIFNLAVFLIYWILIHPEISAKYKYEEPLKYFQMILNHTVPQLVCVMNTMITNCCLSRKIIKPLLLLGCIWIVIDCIQTHIMGEPVFSFLTWETLETPMAAIGMVLWFGFAYIILCSFDESVKAESLNLKIKGNYKIVSKKKK